MSKEKLSGFEPRPVVAERINQLEDLVEKLQIEIEKLKLSEPAKKATKKAVEE